MTQYNTGAPPTYNPNNNPQSLPQSYQSYDVKDQYGPGLNASTGTPPYYNPNNNPQYLPQSQYGPGLNAHHVAPQPQLMHFGQQSISLPT